MATCFMMGEEWSSLTTACGDKRRVFFPFAENILQCYEWDEPEEKWEQVTLQIEDTPTVHPNSKISGCFCGTDDQLIFFQDPSGLLQGLRIDHDGKYTSLPPLLGNNTKQSLIHTAYEADDDSIHVLYFDHETKVIRDLKWNYNAEWQGELHILSLLITVWKNPLTHNQDTIANLGEGFGNYELSSFAKTSSSPQDPVCLAISTNNNTILTINSSGQRVELGTFDRKRFAAGTSEECVNETLTLVKVFADRFGGKTKS
ncbi:hypothetical protein ASPBRDRAFT_662154 [Aspergillus brasiliensis CBS 101740]|uniref:Fucose-specific lectin n=1 Tax=Aspergillus brasiliensis (strain CBS 101740 / IMI 381727 / IBT 21946) TaxID=767769 RepID=A0A1L9U563_ASPBC|nr:hypothetical protein ASPBRDRAFT_662154 [Aspergillus brasiliensis CBS 101740]